MAVAAGAKGRVFRLGSRVVLHGHARPMVDSVAQANVGGRTWAAWRMSTRRLLPDRLVTGATPARHRSARLSRRCKASKASASSVARTIRPTPGKDRRIVTSHGSGLGPSAP